MACGDDDPAAVGGEAGARSPEAGGGGNTSEHDAGEIERQSGSGGSAGETGGGGVGAGGRSGNSGAGAGGQRSNCPEAKHEALSVRCNMTDAVCALTLDQRRERFCSDPSCSAPSPLSCGVFEFQNSCGGRSIGTILGVDVYSEYDHYDPSGKLIGVEVQRSFVPPPCIVFDVYGKACEHTQSTRTDCAAFADAGL
jgi:hypothetical protein